MGSTEERGGGGPLSPHCPSPSDACPRLHSPGGLLNPPGGVESSVDPHVTGGRGEAERAPGDDAQASGLSPGEQGGRGKQREGLHLQEAKGGLGFAPAGVSLTLASRQGHRANWQTLPRR